MISFKILLNFKTVADLLQTKMLKCGDPEGIRTTDPRLRRLNKLVLLNALNFLSAFGAGFVFYKFYIFL